MDVVLFVVEAGRYDAKDKSVVRLLPKDRPVVLVVNKTDRPDARIAEVVEESHDLLLDVASDLDEATRKQLDRGRLVTELMKQQQYAPLSVSEMAITLFAVEKGAFDDVEVKRALACETALHQFVKTKAADLVAKIESSKDLDAEGNKQLAAVIEEFKKSWA